MHDKERKLFFAWLDSPLYDRNPRSKVKMAEVLGVSRPTLNKWERERGEYSSLAFFNSKQKEIDEGILHAVKRGNAQMATLVKKLTGELVEKSEVKHFLTADDYDRIRRKAEDEHGSGVLRISEVSSKPALLPE